MRQRLCMFFVSSAIVDSSQALSKKARIKAIEHEDMVLNHTAFELLLNISLLRTSKWVTMPMSVEGPEITSSWEFRDASMTHFIALLPCLFQALAIAVSTPVIRQNSTFASESPYFLQTEALRETSSPIHNRAWRLHRHLASIQERFPHGVLQWHAVDELPYEAHRTMRYEPETVPVRSAEVLPYIWIVSVSVEWRLCILG